MILTPEMPEAKTAKVFDAITGEVLKHICWVDPEAGKARRFIVDDDGGFKMDPGTQTLIEEEYPNPVSVEPME